jgi:hypothetical protein
MARASAAQTAPKPLPLKHAPQPTTAAITAADLMTRLYIFADDSMMGREVGTPNHLRATAYIEGEARKLGLTPAGDNGTYFQNLPVFDHVLSLKSSINIEGKAYAVGTDFVPRDNSLFGGPVRPIDNSQVVFGGTLTLPVDTSKLLSPTAAEGKFVVITVANGPNGKPLVAGYRQPLTGYYLKSAAIAVVALEGFEADQQKALMEPSEGLQDAPPGDTTKLTFPAFLYVTRPMANALVGRSLDSLTRGRANGARRDHLRLDARASAKRRGHSSGKRSQVGRRVPGDRRPQRPHRVQSHAGRSRFVACL